MNILGLSIIKTAKLRQMKREIGEKTSTITALEKTINELREEIEDITPKRGPGGRFISADEAEITGAPV